MPHTSPIFHRWNKSLFFVCLFSFLSLGLFSPVWADEVSEAKSLYEQGMQAYKAEDFVKAHELLKKSAESGNADAQYQMGTLYRKGQGVTKDNEKAAYWYGKAAKQGLTNAQDDLGNLYDESKEGLKKNADKAGTWIENTTTEGLNQAKGFIDGFTSD